MKKSILLLVFLLAMARSFAQNVGINANGAVPDNSALLDVSSTSKGFLAPRMNTTQMNSIGSPAAGLMVFNTDSSRYFCYTGSAWLKIMAGTDSKWTANNNDIYANNGGKVGIGTTSPSQKLDVNGNINVNNGRLQFSSTGDGVFIGENAGANDQANHVNASTFIGYQTGQSNSSGGENTAVGAHSFPLSTTGAQNTALGNNTLAANTTGGLNTALGYSALNSNTNGTANIGIGYFSAEHVTGGSRNIGIGSLALDSTTNGNQNISIGENSGTRNINGNQNTFLGAYADASSNSLTNATAIGANTVVGSSNSLVLGNNVNVGINTPTPTSALDIYTYNSDAALLDGYSDYGTWLSLKNNTSGGTQFSVISTGDFESEGAGNLLVRDNSDVFMTFNSSTANVGIGTSAPSQKLEVVGTTKTTGLQVTGGANSGYVLQSDASGNASWVNPTSLSIATWTANGNNQYSALSGNVGIGTPTPGQKLDVNGNINLTAGRIVFSSTGNGVFVGTNAGLSDQASNTNNSTFVGYHAGQANITGNENTALGANALLHNTTGQQNTALGNNVLSANTTGSFNTAIGYSALNSLNGGNSNIGIGYFSGEHITNGTLNISLGNLSLDSTTTGGNNLALGEKAGSRNITGSNNTFLGYHANATANALSNATAVGANATVSISNALVLGSGANVGIGTSSPSQKLEVSGTTKTTNLMLTSGASSGYVLQSDASGNGSWVNPNTLTTAVQTVIQDADGNTKVETEQSPNENKIHFTLNGTEYFAMNKGTLEENNSGGCVYVGNAAGLTDGFSADYNTGIGANTLQNNATGAMNVAIGRRALQNNITNFNTAVGVDALRVNVGGTDNAALGSLALGANTSGANNAGIGFGAGSTNSTGSNNTFLGYGSDAGSNNLSNATAVGASSLVSASNCLVLGNNANVGIGNSAPVSRFEVNGAVAFKISTQSGSTTVTLDNTATVWYFTGSASITLPAASGCTNRVYTIVNRSVSARTISSFNNLSGAGTTSIGSNSSIEIISDGTNWLQIQ